MTHPSSMIFPCDFTFKILGRENEQFQGEVLSILHRHFPHLSEGAIRQKQSRQGKYLALSVTIKAESQTQLDAVYQELSESPQVLFVL